MKLVKTHVQYSYFEVRPSHLMKIAIESPEKLTQDEVEAILED